MNKLNLTYLAGMPFTQADLAWMQSSYIDAFAGIAKLAGNMVIISGMEEDGDNVANGWIALNGELLPFVGGDKSIGNFTIVETSVNRTFNDGSSKAIRVDRVATFGVTGEYAYSDLRRIGTLKQMWCIGDQKAVHCNAAYITANFDSTGKGIAGTEREGWAICNGNNGTEDLRGYFLVGYDDRSTNPSNSIWDALYNTPGATGGEKAHILTTGELPQHYFNTAVETTTSNTTSLDDTPTAPIGTRANAEIDGEWKTSIGAGTGTANIGRTNTIGSGLAHENRPNFKVKVFIEKIEA